MTPPPPYFQAETELALNISQDALSSPDAMQTLAREATLLVEDSLKDDSRVYQGGAMQKPGTNQLFEEEELYDASPERKPVRQRPTAAVMQPKTTRQNEEVTTLQVSNRSNLPAKTQSERRAAPTTMTAMDALRAKLPAGAIKVPAKAHAAPEPPGPASHRSANASRVARPVLQSRSPNAQTPSTRRPAHADTGRSAVTGKSISREAEKGTLVPGSWTSAKSQKVNGNLTSSKLSVFSRTSMEPSAGKNKLAPKQKGREQGANGKTSKATQNDQETVRGQSKPLTRAAKRRLEDSEEVNGHDLEKPSKLPSSSCSNYSEGRLKKTRKFAFPKPAQKLASTLGVATRPRAGATKAKAGQSTSQGTHGLEMKPTSTARGNAHTETIHDYKSVRSRMIATGDATQPSDARSHENIVNARNTTECESDKQRKPELTAAGNALQTSIDDFEREVIDYAHDKVQDGTQEEVQRVAEEEVVRVRPTERSAIPPSRQDKNHTAGMEESVEPSDRNKFGKGASQQNAVLVSDVESSGLSGSDIEVEGSKVDDKPCHSERVLKTPAFMRSSPPLLRERAPVAEEPVLVDDQTARRATIISFDKSGPRNQGSISVAKSHASRTRPVRSSLAPSSTAKPRKDKPQTLATTQRDSVAPSATTNSRTSKIERPILRNNVARSAIDALAEFSTKARDLGGLQTGMSPKRAMPPCQSAATAQPEAPGNSDAFCPVDDFDNRTLVEEQFEVHARSNLRPRPSQMAMPPPPPKAAAAARGSRAPPVPSMLDVELRPKSSDGDAELARDRLSTGTAKSSERIAARELHKPVQPRATKRKPEDKASPPQAKRVRQDPNAQSKDDRKYQNAVQVESIHEGLLLHPEDDITDHKALRQTSRRAKNRASQGSQRVDINGSPVPAGLDVPRESTALEVFSQRAGLSSDRDIADIKAVQGTTAPVETAAPEEIEEYWAPPSRQPEPNSSNSKINLDQPVEESPVIQIVRADPDNIVTRKHQKVPSTANPGCGSDETRNQPNADSESSDLVAQLRQMRAEATHRQSEQDRLRMKPAKQLRQSPGQTEGGHISPQSQHDPDSDPDKTLVEPERPTHRTRREISLLSLSSSNSSNSSNATHDDPSALAMWRNALRPHQLNMFDELVNISHRLVAHLVDRETAARHTVEDYRRRGMRIVEQMEQNHVQQHKEYLQALKEAKEGLRREFEQAKEDVSRCVGRVEKARKRREKRAKEAGDMEEKLRSVMEKYC